MKKKILFVNDLIAGGGVEKLMQDMVRHWYKKYDITILTDYKELDFYNYYPKNVKHIYMNPDKEFPDTRIGRRLKKLDRKIFYRRYYKSLRDAGYDTVIAIKDGWPVKYVIDKLDFIPNKYAWVHTDYESYYYTDAIFGSAENEFQYLKRFKKVICVSANIMSSMKNIIGDTGNLMVCYNPIDVSLIKKKSQEVIVDIDTDKDEKITRFITVGRINYQKGYDLLLEACHMLELDGYRFEVWVIGGQESWGNEYNRLMRTAKRLNIKSVNFLGSRSNPYKYMKYADWFLSSSIFEGYSLVSQEAAVLDLPLILTECSGVRELLGDDEYGLVVEPSVYGIYQGMKRIMDFPELYSHYKQKIMERKQIINFKERLQIIEEILQ